MLVGEFYVRPPREAGYGAGDGTSYADAWNGFDAVDWRGLSRRATPAVLWVGSLDDPQSLTRIDVEWPADAS